jgi:hypothetical protein
MLKKRSPSKVSKTGGPKKNMFKNPAFLGFEMNKSIEHEVVEPRFQKKVQRMESRFEKNFNGFD